MVTPHDNRSRILVTYSPPSTKRSSTRALSRPPSCTTAHAVFLVSCTIAVLLLIPVWYIATFHPVTFVVSAATILFLFIVAFSVPKAPLSKSALQDDDDIWSGPECSYCLSHTPHFFLGEGCKADYDARSRRPQVLYARGTPNASSSRMPGPRRRSLSNASTETLISFHDDESYERDLTPPPPSPSRSFLQEVVKVLLAVLCLLFVAGILLPVISSVDLRIDPVSPTPSEVVTTFSLWVTTPVRLFNAFVKRNTILLSDSIVDLVWLLDDGLTTLVG